FSPLRPSLLPPCEQPQVFIAAGTIILWVGFFGFNGGSVQYLGQPASVWVADVARVCANTTVCAAFAGVAVWFVTYRRKEPNLEDTLNGVIGGLVAACATSSIVEAYAACIIGAIAGVVYLGGVYLVNKARIDDPVNATAVHLGCGTWGSVAVGFFASPAAVQRTYQFSDPVPCGLFYGCGGSQLLVQVRAGAGVIWCASRPPCALWPRYGFGGSELLVQVRSFLRPRALRPLLWLWRLTAACAVARAGGIWWRCDSLVQVRVQT
ncbi:unnamed protein product, partial [Closterium sp. NIES-53]